MIEGRGGQFRPRLDRSITPEDPFGAGIETAGRTPIEGNAEVLRSHFFTTESQHSKPLVQDTEMDTALVRVFGLGSRLYTFRDLRFPYRSSWQRDPNPQVIEDVVVIPMTYEDFQSGMEANGKVAGFHFYKIAEKIVRRNLRTLAFLNYSWMNHRMNETSGDGEYIILCGEQTEKGEKITLVGLQKGALAFNLKK